MENGSQAFIHSVVRIQRSYREKKKLIDNLNLEKQKLENLLSGVNLRMNYRSIKTDDYYKYLNQMDEINKYLQNAVYSLKKITSKKYTLWVSHLNFIETELKELCNQVGCRNCHDVLDLYIGDTWKYQIGSLNLIDFYNEVFVPTACNLKDNKKINDVMITFNIVNKDFSEFPSYSSKIYLRKTNIVLSLRDEIYGATLCIPFEDRTLEITGYFIKDPINIYYKHSYLKQRKDSLDEKINELTGISDDFVNKYVKQIPIRDYLLFSPNQISSKMKDLFISIKLMIRKSLSSIIKDFLLANKKKQFSTLVGLVMYNDESKFIGRLLFDMISKDVFMSSENTEEIYHFLHWTVQNELKDIAKIIKKKEEELKELSLDNVSYEKKIGLMRVSNFVKSKAMEKLEEVKSGKSSSDKPEKWLNKLLKIPFGSYQEEEIFSEFSQFAEKLKLEPKINNVQKIIDKSDNIELRDEWNVILERRKRYLKNVNKTLDKCIYGHKKVKLEIEKLIAQWMNGGIDGAVIGLHGPPGVGKTTLAKEGIAKCLTDLEDTPRPFTFFALGGCSNGSTLVGHNYTYVGAINGKIVDMLVETQCMNPIIYIDELDKVSRTEYGKEIVGILTHLTDQSQNESFEDRYFSGIPFDLSKALIIFSYNYQDQIDSILKDRIYQIEVPALSQKDKIVIAKDYLLPEILNKVGYEKDAITIDESEIVYLIEIYTYEAGVRKLKERLFEIIRELNLRFIKENKLKFPVKISRELIDEILEDRDKVTFRKIGKNSRIGVINGLYATEASLGGITVLECIKTYSKDLLAIEITGSLGDVMKESLQCAKTVAWNLLNPESKDQIKKECFGLHIHARGCSVKKDGPSAGGCLSLVILSVLTGIAIKNDVCMTGEIDLMGDIRQIGGLGSKLVGAFRAGCRLCLIPSENKEDLERLRREKIIPLELEVRLVDHVNQTLEHFFVENEYNEYKFNKN